MNYEKIIDLYADPYILAVTIVIILNLMIYFMFAPVVSKKTYFRSFVYMFMTITALSYFHHIAIKKNYDLKLNQDLNLNLVSRTATGGDEIMPELMQVQNNQSPETINVFANEDELI